MSALLTPRQREQGWVVEMPPEMAQITGVPEGSLVLLYSDAGTVAAEILPPPGPAGGVRINQKSGEDKEVCEEAKRT